MADPVWQFYLGDTSSGENLGELPLTVTSPITRVLNGVGTLTGTICADDPMAADTFLGVGVSTNIDREITAVRNGIPVWNGPVTNKSANLRSRVVTLTASEPFFFLQQRVLEWDSSNLWSGATDVYDIVRALFTYATTKDSTGTTSGGTSINAAIPRFSVNPPAGTLSGITKDLTYVGTDRNLISKIINDLVTDPTSGMDFRCDYTLSGSGGLQCDRTLTISAPSLGNLIAGTLTEKDLYDFDKPEDLTRAANRVHMLGSGYVSTQQNTGSVTAGDILREGVASRVDLTDTTQIDNAAKDFRRRAQPPVAGYTLTYEPNDDGGLPFGYANLGDKVNLGISGPSILHSEGHVRVAQIGFLPAAASTGKEQVILTAEISLDSLGA